VWWWWAGLQQKSRAFEAEGRACASREFLTRADIWRREGMGELMVMGIWKGMKIVILCIVVSRNYRNHGNGGQFPRLDVFGRITHWVVRRWDWVLIFWLVTSLKCATEGTNSFVDTEDVRSMSWDPRSICCGLINPPTSLCLSISLLYRARIVRLQSMARSDQNVTDYCILATKASF